MGVYLNCFWQPDSGGMNKAERMEARTIRTFPTHLPTTSFFSAPPAQARWRMPRRLWRGLNFRAQRIDTEPLARMMLRAEAVSSSRIEGLEMPGG